LNNQNRIIKS